MIPILKRALSILLLTLVTKLGVAQKKKPEAPDSDFRSYPMGKVWSGEKHDTLFFSTHLNYSKNVTVFTPTRFGVFGEKYPLILLFDRQDQIIMNYLLHSINYLEQSGQIPRPIVVSIEAGGQDGLRQKEAKWNVDGSDAFGEKFDKFVFEELIADIRKRYPIDENQIIVYGHSWFGYHSSMILAKHIPDLFGVVSTSPCCLSSERISDIVRGVENAASRKRKFYYRVASGHDIGDNLDVYRELTGRLTTIRLPEQFDYKPEWLGSAMHMEVPGLFFLRSLYEMYEEWADLAYAYADPQRSPTYDDSQLYDSLQALSDVKYGFRIPFNDRHLEMRVTYYRFVRNDKVTNEGRIATLNFIMSKFGERKEWFEQMAQAYENLGQPDMAKKFRSKAKNSTSSINQ